MPLRIFPHKPTFDFMGKRWMGFAISIAFTLASFGLIAVKGLNFGIDFTGGIVMEIHTEQPADLALMREKLSLPEFGEVTLQNAGAADDVLIRFQLSEDQEQAKIVAKVREALSEAVSGEIDYRKIEYVGPTVGRELIRGGVIAVALAFAAIMTYVWFRFEWQYSVGALLALLHDSIMLIGFFSLTQLEFGLTAIAAVLTIIGYSINDSVVIYDRIRENLRRYKKMPIFELLNHSINDTLSRTVLTATTTLLAALSLLFFGGEVIRAFSAAMVFGVIIGTYSSIYISAPTLLYLKIRDESQGAVDGASRA